MADVKYNSAAVNFAQGEINLATDSIKMMLVTSTYVPNGDTHAFRSDVTNEVVGTAYTLGGKVMTTPLVTQDDTLNNAKFDTDDVAWAASTITAAAAVIYKDVGTAGTDPLIAYYDFGGDIVSVAGTLTVTINVLGVLTIG